RASQSVETIHSVTQEVSLAGVGLGGVIVIGLTAIVTAVVGPPVRPCAPQAKPTRIRRFWRPLFSIFCTATGPISAVDATWVPPHGWRSTPPPAPISTSRTLPVPIGGLTAM